MKMNFQVSCARYISRPCRTRYLYLRNVASVQARLQDRRKNKIKCYLVNTSECSAPPSSAFAQIQLRVWLLFSNGTARNQQVHGVFLCSFVCYQRKSACVCDCVGACDKERKPATQQRILLVFRRDYNTPYAFTVYSVLGNWTHSIFGYENTNKTTNITARCVTIVHVDTKYAAARKRYMYICRVVVLFSAGCIR